MNAICEIEVPTLQQRLENWGDWSNTIKRERIQRNGEINLVDARNVFAAILQLPHMHIGMLEGAFVSQLSPDELCRRLLLPTRPASIFVVAFREAENALQAILDRDHD